MTSPHDDPWPPDDPWPEPGARRILCEAPRIRAVEGFLPPDACDALIALARGRLAPATVFDAQTGRPAADPTRSNSAAEFPLADPPPLLARVRARIAATTGLPVGAMEAAQVLHYAPGQGFDAHVDYLDPSLPAYAEALRTQGQRIATVLVYLNDGFEGGATAFPRLGIAVQGRRGEALYFANVDQARRPDPLTLHAGLPPTRGEKWLLSQWVRDRARAD